MRLLLLLLCLLFCTGGKGQVKEMVILEEGDMGSLWYGSQRMDKFKELDHTLLTVTYRMNFIQDTVKRKILVDQMILQIGKNYSKFYSQRTFLDDMSYTDFEMGKTVREEGYGIDGTVYIDWDMIFDLSKRTVTTIHRMPYEDEVSKFYSEPMPVLQWEYIDGADSVCGYACHVARTCYAGRLWKAYYTTDIPLNFGPWKLSGLPGLILKAVDSSGEYEFICEGLSDESQPIRSYKWRSKSISKENWRRFERRIHTAPLEALTAGGTRVFRVYDPQTKKSRDLTAEWTVPYNPIERE